MCYLLGFQPNQIPGIPVQPFNDVVESVGVPVDLPDVSLELFGGDRPLGKVQRLRKSFCRNDPGNSEVDQQSPDCRLVHMSISFMSVSVRVV